MQPANFQGRDPSVGWLRRASAALAVFVALLAVSLPLRLRAEETAHRIASLLELREGMKVADVGAGTGQIAEVLSGYLGPRGRMYVTEIDARRLEQLRELAASAAAANVEVIEAGDRESRLPPSCCDAILLRRVYHHLSDPKPYLASLARALTPGGRLVIIDFEPRWAGHGTRRGTLATELSEAGFAVERNEADWAGHDYLLVARIAAAPGSTPAR